MLRLLFVNKDEDKRLTVITDGIDNQYNVFVTETPLGDMDYYKSLGIVIEAGHTYNIGLFKEWAKNAFVKLLGYPEGYNDNEILFQDITEEYNYVFTTSEPTLNFPGTGGSDHYVITSTKQLVVNGKPVGNVEIVPFKVAISGTGFTNTPDTDIIVAAANPGDTQRKGTLTATQDETGKTLQISLVQAAGTVTWNYVLTANPTSLSFVGGGETKTVTITSTKQKVVNGTPSGSATNVSFTSTVTGTGFSKGTGENSAVAAANQTEAARNGKMVVKQAESNKTVEISLNQAAGVVTWDYVITPNPTSLSFVGGGETKKLTGITSTKQKKINGTNSGSPVTVAYTTTVTGTGFTKGADDLTVVAAANQTEAQRTGKLTIKQSEGTKTVDVTLTQAAGVVTYTYNFIVTPETMRLPKEATTDQYVVTSNKQKKINGTNSGSPVDVDFTVKIEGEGFSQGETKKHLVATANTGTAERTGKATFTQNESNKTSVSTIIQAGTTA